MITPVYSNIKEFINNGKNVVLSYQSLSFIQTFNDIKFPIHNVLNDYLDEIKDECIKVTLTEDEMTLYKYKPRLLSAALYGTTELFFLILMINGMASEKEFIKKDIILLTKNKINDVINKIYTAEHPSIESYNNRLMAEYQNE